MKTMDHDALSPQLFKEDGTLVIRPVLGLTAYLADPSWWALQGTSQVLSTFVETVSPARLQFFTTSLLNSWMLLTTDQLSSAIKSMSAWALVSNRPRHHFFAKFADFPNVPEAGFSYTEVDPSRATRAAVLELTLPLETPPDQLARLALQIADLGLVYSMVGGYAVRWNPIHKRLAFNQFYLWAHRFVGLDAQQPEEMAWFAPAALPGSNWLTFVGAPLAEKREIDLKGLVRRTWKGPVTPIERTRGVLLRAGVTPTVGDLNELEFPEAYSEVAQHLAAHFVREPPPFWGAFMEDDGTRRWMQRLIDPALWPPT